MIIADSRLNSEDRAFFFFDQNLAIFPALHCGHCAIQPDTFLRTGTTLLLGILATEYPQLCSSLRVVVKDRELPYVGYGPSHEVAVAGDWLLQGDKGQIP